jgi:apolipoprotein D and lipocalin family protein
MRQLTSALPALLLGISMAFLSACTSQPPITPVAHVDLKRYMGDWYVIASIPTRFERNAYNAVESYEMRPDGRIQTVFRYREGSFGGKLKTMHPTGFVEPDSENAIWSMQFLWPFKAEYVIAWLDPSYRMVVVARSKRDYVWIMARTPSIPEPQYELLSMRVAALGYDPKELRRVPQQWPEDSSSQTSLSAKAKSLADENLNLAGPR